MSIYLSDEAHAWWSEHLHDEPGATLLRSMAVRAAARAAQPGLRDREASVDWWHLVVEYLAEATMAWRLNAQPELAAWIGAVVDDLLARDQQQWIGPWFRDHHLDPPRGHLETAHVCIALAAAVDLAGDALGEARAAATRQMLGQRGVPLCSRWLEGTAYYNQRCILAAGLAAAATAAGDSRGIGRAADEFRLCRDLFHEDGSYDESSQYAGYAAWGMMVIYETLAGYDPALAAELSPEPYARCVRWWAANLMYVKPLAGWGPAGRARMVNFNDAGAIAAPDGDVLLHIAARCAATMPEEAALARWLFEQGHLPALDAGPFDRASFGFVTRPGFLAPALWARGSVVTGRSPAELNVPTLQPFTNGDVVARDRWAGRTVLAMRGGTQSRRTSHHQHADLNSFILTHNHERLLLDPGHSCYRGLSIEHDRATTCHNTCTFALPGKATPASLQQQHTGEAVRLVDGRFPGPAPRGGRVLISEQLEDINIIGAECAEVYGPPIRRFARYWLLAGAHALFIVDHFLADEPVIARWHWLLNNRDGALRLKVFPPDRLVAQRGNAGLKLFHAGDNLAPTSGRMRHALVHDAYHPKPGQLGEGRPDSGIIVNFSQHRAAASSLCIHAIAVDTPGRITGWHLKRDGRRIGLEAPGAAALWSVEVDQEQSRLTLSEQRSGRACALSIHPDPPPHRLEPCPPPQA